MCSGSSIGVLYKHPSDRYRAVAVGLLYVDLLVTVKSKFWFSLIPILASNEVQIWKIMEVTLILTNGNLDYIKFDTYCWLKIKIVPTKFQIAFLRTEKTEL